MSQFILYQSNSLEKLSARFCDEVASKPLPPTETEHILVQSIGMGRWLALALSDSLGCWGNSKYIYPNVLADMIFSAALTGNHELSDRHFDTSTSSVQRELSDRQGLLPGFYDTNEYNEKNNTKQNLFSGYSREGIISKDEIQWRVFSLLPSLARNPLYAPLSGYASHTDERVRFQIAGKIADSFDQYTISRYRMIAEWNKGKNDLVAGNKREALNGDDAWQSDLWRIIRTQSGKSDRAELLSNLESVDISKVDREKLPKRLSVFGVSTLFSYHLELLAWLSSIIDVRIFVLAPADGYFGDIVSPKRRIRSGIKKETLASIDESDKSGWNPLLASLGGLSIDFQNQLASFVNDDGTLDSDRIEPDEKTILGSVQHDVLYNVKPESPRIVRADDESISIHSTFGDRRECEALREFIIKCFERNKDLQPRDILVMATDIDRFAPHIEAVFSRPVELRNGSLSTIPYSIADRALRRVGTLSDMLRRIIEIQSQNFSASAVYDIISYQALRDTFNIDDDLLARIRRLITDAAIHNGRNELDRKDQYDFAYREFSWEYGIDRLLAGYALRQNGETLFEGIAPVEGSEGAGADALEILLSVYRKLADLSLSVSAPHSVDEWCEIIIGAVDLFFEENDDNSWEFDSLRRGIETLKHGSQSARFELNISCGVFLDALFARIDDSSRQYGFLNGRITFCATLPMRSIPFRVIALIGMNEGIFPRSNNAPGFDLIARNMIAGDRSQRKDDRALFLETILSARDNLYFSYSGRSSIDNAELPASTVLRELEEYIRVNYRFKDSNDPDAVIAKIRHEHPLHPFSSSVFNGKDERSFDARYCRLARAAADPSGASPFVTAPIEPKDLPHEIQLADLLSMFANPSRYFCRRVLLLDIARMDDEISADEPLKPEFDDYLEYSDRIVRLAFNGTDPALAQKYARAAGLTPPGEWGELTLEGIESASLDMAKKLTSVTNEKSVSADVEIHVSADGTEYTVRGTLDDICGGILLRWRIGKEWDKDVLTLWIEHLASSACGANPNGTVFVLSDESIRYAALSKEKAIVYLQGIIGWYIKGLSSPLHYFSHSSLAYADALMKNKSTDGALSAARERWSPAYSKSTGDISDPYIMRCFSVSPASSHPDYPLGTAEFDSIARELVIPALRERCE